MRAFGNDVSEWCDSRDRAEMTSRPGPKYVPYPPFGSETNIVPKIPGPCWGPSNATGHRVQPSMVVSHRGFLALFHRCGDRQRSAGLQPWLGVLHVIAGLRHR